MVYQAYTDGILYAFNATNGRPRWKFPSDGSLFAPPARDANGTLYLGTRSKDGKGTLYAIRPDGT